MNKTKIHWVLALSAVGIIALICFWWLRGPAKPERMIKVPLFYDYPLLFLPEKIAMCNGNPNHPNHYTVDIGLHCGTVAKPQYCIHVYSCEVYCTSVIEMYLNVETGFLKADISISGREAHYALQPPTQNSNTNDYLTQLDSLKQIIEIIAGGCYIPEEGFNYPPHPELKNTCQYIDNIIQQLKKK